MTITLIILALLVLALHACRQYWFKRELPQTHSQPFTGDLYQAGSTHIAVLNPAGEGANDDEKKAQHSIICFPGFLEDQRYFLSLYQDMVKKGYQLILVNNANYHSPFVRSDINSVVATEGAGRDSITRINWGSNPHALGSIEYDGFQLAQTIKKLASGDNITLHGHSRGGAVVMEAGRQFPELMKNDQRQVRAILEAAVVPQGTQAGGKRGPVVAAITLYLMPLIMGLSRKLSLKKLVKMPMMQPATPVKEQLLLSIFCNTKSYATCVRNVQSIVDWQQRHHADLYENFATIEVLIGERDDVLDTKTMIASAEQGATKNPGVTVHQTQHTNHFISVETPEVLYGLFK